MRGAVVKTAKGVSESNRRQEEVSVACSPGALAQHVGGSNVGTGDAEQDSSSVELQSVRVY